MSSQLSKQLIKDAGLDQPDMCPIDEWDNPELYALIFSVVEHCCDMMVKLETKYPVNLTVREIKKQFGMIVENNENP